MKGGAGTWEQGWEGEGQASGATGGCPPPPNQRWGKLSPRAPLASLCLAANPSSHLLRAGSREDFVQESQAHLHIKVQFLGVGRQPWKWQGGVLVWKLLLHGAENGPQTLLEDPGFGHWMEQHVVGSGSTVLGKSLSL